MKKILLNAPNSREVSEKFSKSEALASKCAQGKEGHVEIFLSKKLEMAYVICAQPR